MGHSCGINDIGAEVNWKQGKVVVQCMVMKIVMVGIVFDNAIDSG